MTITYNPTVISTTTPLKGDCTEHSLVQKSYPMLSLWSSPLTLQELKILDTYLARIDSHSPEHRWVQFQKGELESILGVRRIKPQDLKERLRHLCIVLELEDPSAPRGFRSITLFEQMFCNQDNDGLWQVDMQCTTAAMQYIFNIDNIGYLKYRLQAILHLRSRYSYVLFLYVERNGFRKTWDASLDELRQILRCDEPSYKEFRRFNDRILKRAQREILDKTDCVFSYETVKKGRKVQAVRFIYEGDSYPEPNAPKPSIDESPTRLVENPKRTKIISFLRGACTRNGEPEFSELEMAHILEILRIIPPSLMPNYTPGANISFTMFHYLCERYAAMNCIDATGIIRNRFAYFIRMLKQDAGIQAR